MKSELKLNAENRLNVANYLQSSLFCLMYKHMVLHIYVNEYIITYWNTCMHCYYMK